MTEIRRMWRDQPILMRHRRPFHQFIPVGCSRRSLLEEKERGIPEQAAAAVADNKTLKKRVWLTRLAIDFAWLARYDEFQQESRKTEVPFLEWAKPHTVLEELATYRNVWGPYRTWKDFRFSDDALRKRFPSKADSGSGHH